MKLRYEGKVAYATPRGLIRPGNIIDVMPADKDISFFENAVKSGLFVKIDETASAPANEVKDSVAMTADVNVTYTPEKQSEKPVTDHAPEEEPVKVFSRKRKK